MGAVSNVLPAQRGLYVVIGAKLSRFQSRLRVYNIYGWPNRALSERFFEVDFGQESTCTKLIRYADSVVYGSVSQTCQPSRIFRDNPGNLTSLPESRNTVA